MQMSETVQWRWQCPSPNWSWGSNTLATWWEEPTYWKRPWCWEDWRREEKGTTKDEMVGWHHLLDGQEFEQAKGEGEGQGSLACCSPWGWTRLSDWTTGGDKESRRNVRGSAWGFSRVRLSVTPQTAAARRLCPRNLPGKNTGVGCHFLLQF